MYKMRKCKEIRKNIRNKIIEKSSIVILSGMIMTGFCACGQNNNEDLDIQYIEIEQTINSETIPIIIRDEQETPIAEESTSFAAEETEEEETTEVVAFVDRGEKVEYEVESAMYESEGIKINYPQLSNMKNTQLQSDINEYIKNISAAGTDEENLISYELQFETSSKGNSIVSFIFRGYKESSDNAYPVKIVKTLNIDLKDGRNLRLKDYADIGEIVSCLETDKGYIVINDEVNLSEFSSFLNNGYVTDYALTLPDYDVDINNTEMNVLGYSAIRNNRLVLFVEAEHGMGDYVELEFEKDL